MPATTTVVHCLAQWGTEMFADTFLEELAENENDLPLQNLCLSGGHPASDDSVELDNLQLHGESDGIVTGSFDVYFTEASPTGCRDMTWTDERDGKIEFKLNIGSGEVEFDDPLPKREYDPEEF